MSVLALTACNKSNNDQGTAAPTETVKITQADPPPGGTWADVVNATSDGFMMGNPNAKVKLIEIASLSCPHCKAFEDEGVPKLVEDYVKAGKISWELRPYLIHGPLDMPANLIAYCVGPKTFFPLVRALYQDQDQWTAKIQAVPQDKLTQVQNLPPTQTFVQLATLGGLQDWAAARGVPAAKSNQCLSDQQQIDRQVQITSNVTNQYPTFAGTPSFILNGTLLDKTASWAALKPQLDAALK